MAMNGSSMQYNRPVHTVYDTYASSPNTTNSRIIKQKDDSSGYKFTLTEVPDKNQLRFRLFHSYGDEIDFTPPAEDRGIRAYTDTEERYKPGFFSKKSVIKMEIHNSKNQPIT